MAEKKRAIHAGHRGRVKEEFLVRGVEGWPDHRVLELLLFYAIPRYDVNPLAHELIDRFGSLDRVLDALPEELMKVKVKVKARVRGKEQERELKVTEHAATLLKLIPAVTGRYLEDRTGPGTVIHTAEEAGHALMPYFYGSRNEMVYVLCLDAKEKQVGIRKISEGNNTNSDVTIRRVAEECMALQASACYLAHNHVSGIALPSPEDMNATAVIREALRPLGVEVLDHLVFVDGDFVSDKETRRAGRAGGFRLLCVSQN